MTRKPRSPRKPTPSRAASAPSAVAQALQSIAQPEPSADKHSLAHIHDLRSVAMLSLPQGLRALIGDETFEALVARLETLELRMVLRPEGKVVFLAMALVTVDQDKLGPLPDTEASRGFPEAAANSAAPAAPSSSAAATTQAAPRKARKPRGAS